MGDMSRCWFNLLYFRCIKLFLVSSIIPIIFRQKCFLPFRGRKPMNNFKDWKDSRVLYETNKVRLNGIEFRGTIRFVLASGALVANSHFDYLTYSWKTSVCPSVTKTTGDSKFVPTCFGTSSIWHGVSHKFVRYNIRKSYTFMSRAWRHFKVGCFSVI